MPAAKTEDYSWEKEFAPKIGRGYVLFVACLFGLWIAFLTGIAVNRWFGALQ